MNRVKRVELAIRHTEPDRVPVGEFYLEDQVIAGLLGISGPVEFHHRVRAYSMLGLDAIGVQVSGRHSFEEITRWRSDTDFYVFAVVDGPFSACLRYAGFTGFLTMLLQDEPGAGELLDAAAAESAHMARMGVEAGAHALMLADDLAYTSSTYVSPDLLRRLVFPRLAMVVGEVKRAGVPVFFHSDGNIRSILEDIVYAGFDGLHSLDPSGGMDIALVKQWYGDRLCLMGNLDGGLLTIGAEEEIDNAVRELMRAAAPGGGFIFGSSMGVIGPQVPVKNLLAMYRAAAEYGGYPRSLS